MVNSGIAGKEVEGETGGVAVRDVSSFGSRRQAARISEEYASMTRLEMPKPERSEMVAG